MPNSNIAPAGNSAFAYGDDPKEQRAKIDKLVEDTLEAHWAHKDIEIERQNRRMKRHRLK